MAKKKLSSPYATGGGGHLFEAQVQAAYVVLMLAGERVPHVVENRLVKKITVQGKIDGYAMDDLIVTLYNPSDKKDTSKLLGEVKSSVAIAKSNKTFNDVIKAAWADFNNEEVFTKGKDKLVLYTSALNAAGGEVVRWLLKQARITTTEEFTKRVNEPGFGPAKRKEKLDVFKHLIKEANVGEDVPEGTLHEFLRHFYIFEYDFNKEHSFFLAFLHKCIAQFQPKDAEPIWSRVVDFVQNRNKKAAPITPDSMPASIKDKFKPVGVQWGKHPKSNYLALACLVGEWDERNQNDIQTVAKLFGINYNDWQDIANELLNEEGSPLLYNNGVWKISNRLQLLKQVGGSVLMSNLKTYREVATSILGERDKTLTLPREERFMVRAKGEALSYSEGIRKGVSDGLAMLGGRPDVCGRCPSVKVENTARMVVRAVLSDSDWTSWASLNNLLPALAEATPDIFMEVLEKSWDQSPDIFNALFARESDEPLFDENYMTGILWASERLAWDEQYFVCVCRILAGLTERDPGGPWSNRPINSLINILLPWKKQTLALVGKRLTAVESVLKDYPGCGWDLLFNLLPDSHYFALETQKPLFRKIIPENWDDKVTIAEYREQVLCYAGWLIDAAGHNTNRLIQIIKISRNLPGETFNKFYEKFSAGEMACLPQEQKTLLWETLTSLVNENKKYPDANWELSGGKIATVEKAAGALAPVALVEKHKHLFSLEDFNLYEGEGDWEHQQEILNSRRDTAIQDIFQNGGMSDIIKFAESVTKPYVVGGGLGSIEDKTIPQTIFPRFLDAENKTRDLAQGYIAKQYKIGGWEWCDNLDRSSWTPSQTGCFLAYTPFRKEAWDKAEEWLGEAQGEYWSRVDNVRILDDGNDYSDYCIAVNKLLKFNRPLLAIRYMDFIGHRANRPCDVELCLQALRAALSAREFIDRDVNYQMANLIKSLQFNPLVNQKDMVEIEWMYFPLLDRHSFGTGPISLQKEISTNPEFFHQLIQMIYRSEYAAPASGAEVLAETKANAKCAYHLFGMWKIIPGMEKDGLFNEGLFDGWLAHVKNLCVESGYINWALEHIGNVLIYAPADPDGLWIHKHIAETLNQRDNQVMRDGFSTGKYNSHDFVWVDPTGKSEKDLADEYRRQAEEVENAGFHRLAVTLRKLASTYDKEAQRRIEEHRGNV